MKSLPIDISISKIKNEGYSSSTSYLLMEQVPPFKQSMIEIFQKYAHWLSAGIILGLESLPTDISHISKIKTEGFSSGTSISYLLMEQVPPFKQSMIKIFQQYAQWLSAGIILGLEYTTFEISFKIF